MEPVGYFLNAMVSLVVALGGLGVINYRANRRRLHSQSEVDEANADLIEGQLTINLSQEARELVALYKGNAIEARTEAYEARKLALIDRARLDFVVSYLRSQNIPIPEFPEALQ